MRRLLASLAIALALSAPADAVRAELLASFEATAQGEDTGHAYFGFADVDLVIGDELVRLFDDDEALGPTETPVLFEATAFSDPTDFATAAALFTNDEPDEFVIEFTGVSGGGIGVGTNDCALFHGDYECGAGVDMQGGSIDRITLEVRRLSLVELVDPVAGTAIEVDVALEVFGVPEPAAALRGIAAAVALGALALSRRSS
jgi:hypothetical protein